MVLIAVIILSNVTQGTAIIGHESQFYGQFAEQTSFSWDFSGFGVSMLCLPAEYQFTSAPLSLPNQGLPSARAVFGVGWGGMIIDFP